MLLLDTLLKNFSCFKTYLIHRKPLKETHCIIGTMSTKPALFNKPKLPNSEKRF